LVKVYVLNAGYIFWFLYGSVKPFLLQRQKDRIQFIGSTQKEIRDTLTETIDPS